MIIGPEYATPEWERFRCGKVTASRFADVLTEARSVPEAVVEKYAHLVSEERFRRLKSGPNAGELKQVEGYPTLVREAMKRNGIYLWGETAVKYRLQVVASEFTGKMPLGGRSAAMERGKDKERDAIDRYMRDRFMDPWEVGEGRILQREGTIVCATPDGFVDDDTEGPGILEVKCPNSDTHLSYWLEWRDRVKQNIPHQPPQEYVEQVQGELWMSERRWCDFISFDDRFPPGMQIVVARVYRDEDYIGSTLAPPVNAFAKQIVEQVAEIKAHLATLPGHQQEQLINSLATTSEEQA